MCREEAPLRFLTVTYTASAPLRTMPAVGLGTGMAHMGEKVCLLLLALSSLSWGQPVYSSLGCIMNLTWGIVPWKVCLWTQMIHYERPHMLLFSNFILLLNILFYLFYIIEWFMYYVICYICFTLYLWSIESWKYRKNIVHPFHHLLSLNKVQRQFYSKENREEMK